MHTKIIIPFFALILILFSTKNTTAQSVEIMAGNTLNGAVNGTILGAASMALYNTSKFDALRIGLGLGTLYGIGMGVYDISAGHGGKVLVTGLFNNGNNSSIIVLLDTFYGAAAGSIIVTAVMLVANEPLVDGLQYGSGIGAWVGFGFGLFDTSVLARRSYTPIASVIQPNNNANGLLGLNFDNGKSLGFINPGLIQTAELTSNNYSGTIRPAVEVVNFKFNF